MEFLADPQDFMDQATGEPLTSGIQALHLFEGLQERPRRHAKSLTDALMQLEKSYLHCAPAEVEKRVVLLEQRIVQVKEGESSRIQTLYEQAKRLDEGLQALRVSQEIHDERRKKELKMVESNVMSDVQKAASDRQDLERRLQESTDAVVGDCRAEFLKEQSRREAVHDEYGREIGEEVQRLHVLLEKQQSTRAEYGEQIIAHLEAEFQKVHDAIVSEQQLRFEAEGMMLRMVEDVCGRLHGEIQKERSQREAVQNKLLCLLEDTCGQIEKSFSYLSVASKATPDAY